MDLYEGARERPDPVRKVGRDVPDQEGPDRRVKRRPDKEPHEADTDDDSRKGKRQKAQGFENSRGGCSHLNDGVRDKEGESDTEGCTDHPQEEAIL